MAGINKVILIGNLGRDPEVRYTQGGMAVAELNLATTRTFTDRNNERREETEWHRVKVFGKQAETCQQFLSKGRQVYVEGRLQTRSWDDKDGNKRYTTEVVAETIQFLGGRGGEAGAGAGGRRAASGDAPSYGGGAPARAGGDRGGGGGGGGYGGGYGGGGPVDDGPPAHFDQGYADPGDDDIPF